MLSDVGNNLGFILLDVDVEEGEMIELVELIYESSSYDRMEASSRIYQIKNIKNKAPKQIFDLRNGSYDIDRHLDHILNDLNYDQFLGEDEFDLGDDSKAWLESTFTKLENLSYPKLSDEDLNNEALYKDATKILSQLDSLPLTEYILMTNITLLKAIMELPFEKLSIDTLNTFGKYFGLEAGEKAEIIQEKFAQQLEDKEEFSIGLFEKENIIAKPFNNSSILSVVEKHCNRFTRIKKGPLNSPLFNPRSAKYLRKVCVD